MKVVSGWQQPAATLHLPHATFSASSLILAPDRLHHARYVDLREHCILYDILRMQVPVVKDTTARFSERLF